MSQKTITLPRLLAQSMARLVFKKRGDHSEAHIQEAELAAIIETTILVYKDRLENGPS